MINRIQRHRLQLCLLLFVALLSGCASLAPQRSSPGFSFAVLSDPHSARDSWINSLAEVRDMNVNPDPKFTRSAFILVCGDTNPVDKRFEDYNEVFKDLRDKPVYLPVIGNHEFDDAGGTPGDTGMRQGSTPQVSGGSKAAPSAAEGGTMQGAGATPMMPANQPKVNQVNGDPSIIDMQFISDKIINAIPGAVRMSDKSSSYYYDYRNVRVISLDGYSGEAGTQCVINEKGRKWTEDVITSAPSHIDHIFVAFHVPAFPRWRQTFNFPKPDPEQRDAFWNMLVSHRDRVRAVFSGHTHYYSRIRVLNPAASAADDNNAYPDEDGGIYQVTAGSTGNGMENTFLRVEIHGNDVYFRAYEAENGKDKPFAVKEEWSLMGN